VLLRLVLVAPARPSDAATRYRCGRGRRHGVRDERRSNAGWQPNPRIRGTRPPGAV